MSILKPIETWETSLLIVSYCPVDIDYIYDSGLFYQKTTI